jgi:hypothetical protein
MVGDLTPPPPPTTYESQSSRCKAAREVLRYTRRRKGTVSEGVRPEYGRGEAVGRTLNPHGPGDQQLKEKMETMGGKKEMIGD